MKNAEHERALKELEQVLIDNADKITEEDVRVLLSSVGIDYEQVRAKYKGQ